MEYRYAGRGYMRISITECDKRYFTIDEVLRQEFDQASEIRFLDTCPCNQCYIPQPLLDLTGITMTDHREWRECLAVRVLEYCNRIHGNEIPTHELFILSQLGYSRALDDHIVRFQPEDLTLCELTELACKNINEGLCLNAAILLYIKQKRGKITKSARH